jgi:hypothetical protein
MAGEPSWRAAMISDLRERYLGLADETTPSVRRTELDAEED